MRIFAILCGAVSLPPLAVIGVRPEAGCLSQEAPRAGSQRPLLREFMGLNVHTVQFKPDLYRPVCRLLRDYHPFDWDVGDETDFAPEFPFARNRVNWESLYGEWVRKGYSVSACVLFDNLPPTRWKDMARDSFQYGLRFAQFFGPSGQRRLADTIEIGNEPGLYDDAAYRAIFENMARGARQGDAKLRIATCALTAGPSHRYAKSVSCVKGLESLYDVLTLHSYAEVEGWPTWRRSYPEDPAIKYMADVRAIQQWRDANAPGKPVWLTEFGWDASTKPAPSTGDFKQWVGSTETQQAQWIVRSFLIFAGMGLDRAYLFWFNDRDEPQVHGSSGLTRDYQPKPSFHAVAHLQAKLGAYRFSRVIAQRPEYWLYEFASADSGMVWVVWSPTGSGIEKRIAIPKPPARITRAERMPLGPGEAPRVVWREASGKVTLPVGESPAYLFLGSGRARVSSGSGRLARR